MSAEMSDRLLSDAIHQLLAGCCTPAVVRALEEGGLSEPLWSDLQASGFVDAMLPEEAGGAGLGLRDAFAVVEACGYHALPLPLAQTMVARALLAGAGQAPPAGCIALATQTRGVRPIWVSYGAVADWVLLEEGGQLRLLPASGAQRQPLVRSTDAALQWTRDEGAQAPIAGPSCGLRALEATLLAGQMVGAMRRLLDMTLAYANDRQQFGRSIGKFQAIQHELAVMAQEAEAAHMAARMAFDTAEVAPDRLLAAVAKARVSEAAAPVAAVAHAVHGAIGITEAFDLQLYTRRLQAWRVAAGSESYWHREVGQTLLASGLSVSDFARTRLSP